MGRLEFGRYVLHQKIAVGGMAELFKASLHGEEGFERPVAIKRILPNLAEDAEFVRMFIDEAKIAVQLSHPNIANVLDLGCEGGNYYIAQEFVDGKDLQAIHAAAGRRRGRMPPQIVVHVAMKVCEALHHAHQASGPGGGSMGLIHRDVSPQNVLVSYEGDVKVVDFGLAKAAGRAVQTQAGIVKGKLAYMSPEQACGAELDHRSDIYSLGICLFELLTGKTLFQRKSDVETLVAVQGGKVPELRYVEPSLDAELTDIVARALAKSPQERFQTAMELHDALEVYCYTHGRTVGRNELTSYMRWLFPSASTSSSEAPGQPDGSMPCDTVASPPGYEVVADDTTVMSPIPLESAPTLVHEPLRREISEAPTRVARPTEDPARGEPDDG